MASPALGALTAGSRAAEAVSLTGHIPKVLGTPRDGPVTKARRPPQKEGLPQGVQGIPTGPSTLHHRSAALGLKGFLQEARPVLEYDEYASGPSLVMGRLASR